MLKIGAVCLIAIGLVGCAGQPQMPAQPTPTTIQAANIDIAQLSTDPIQTFHAGLRVARAACQVYLNEEAAQAAGLSQLGVGAGALGVGLSAINPLAGIASSLFQTFLTAYRAAGAMPYTPETSAIVLGAMDAYEAAAGAPPDNDTAVSWVDDVWFSCTPAGYAMLASQAIATANVGAQPNAMPGVPASLAQFRSGRPVVTINNRPVP